MLATQPVISVVVAPGREHLGHADLLEDRDVLVGDDPAAEDHDVGGVALGEQLDQPLEERHVRPGEHGETDQVGVLLDRGLDDLLRRLVQPGVDHLVAGVAQCPRDDLGPAVVAVEAWLADDDADPSMPGGHAAEAERDLALRKTLSHMFRTGRCLRDRDRSVIVVVSLDFSLQSVHRLGQRRSNVMGNHRAERRGPRRSSLEASEATPSTPAAGSPGRTSAAAVDLVRRVEPGCRSPRRRPVEPQSARPSTTSRSPRPCPSQAAPGKRKAVRHAGSPRPAVPRPARRAGAPRRRRLAISAGGARHVHRRRARPADEPRPAASALSGASGIGTVSLLGPQRPVSRDSRRDALEDAADAELVPRPRQQAEQRDAALGKLAKQAEQQADKLARTTGCCRSAGYHHRHVRRVRPVVELPHRPRLQRRHRHPIMAIANGVVTSAGYDGAYGNKTVVTLDDGTEIWYCHQTSYTVIGGETSAPAR